MDLSINLRKRLEERLTRIERKLDELIEQGRKIMADLTALQAEVDRNTSVEKSALLLIQGIAAQLQAAGTDPAKLATLLGQLKANDDELAAAVVANTPAAAPPAPATS